MLPLPSEPKIIKSEGNRAIFEIGGCYPGYGFTLGNALRRVILSSLSGAAVTSVKIKGVNHEFSTIPYVLEDVVEIILNLKQIRFKLHSDEAVKISLKVKGEKEAKASDIKVTSDVEIINKDAHVATLTHKKAELEMEIEVNQGLGYVPVEQRKKEKLEVGMIAVDAIFTPIKRVNYEVENMRVGDRTDYNLLRLDIETDGSITPQESLEKAAKILVGYFNVFAAVEKKKGEKKKTKKAARAKKKVAKKSVEKKKVGRKKKAKNKKKV